MICRLLVFRHAETFDNSRDIFSGWRDSKLTPNGILQAEKVAKQLAPYRIDYAFTSHLRRARQTLKIVLKERPAIPVFVDDRLMERCYGLMQGKSKKKVELEDPGFYERCHRGYSSPPPQGESLEMVEKRVVAFYVQLTEWLKQNPGNVAISCHNNSIRPFRRIFENLSITQMCKLESPQDRSLIFNVDLGDSDIDGAKQKAKKATWRGVLIPKGVRLATDPQNPFKQYYART